MKTNTRNYPFNWALMLAGMFLGLTLTVGFQATSLSHAQQDLNSMDDRGLVAKVQGADPQTDPAVISIDNDQMRSSLDVAHDLSNAFAMVADAVNPMIVTIFTETDVQMRRNVDPRYEDFFERFFKNNNTSSISKGKKTGLGSGVIVDENGVILTNNHVVHDADKIKVRLMDGREFVAKVQGADPQTDLAVISIDASHLESAVLGDSDQSRVGEWVLAIGSPLDENLDHTVTSGIISAKGRSGVGLTKYEDFIQTDAAINPGNSGGALVNLDGHVIGINTAIATHNGGNMGIGFAIPANLARKVMEDILEKGAVERGWLGVHIQTMSPTLADAFGLEVPQGVIVSHVAEGSPAERAGFLEEDVILSFDGKNIDNAVELSTLVAGSSPGSKVALDIFRNGKRKEITVTLDQLNPTETAASDGESSVEDIGITVSNITPELADQYQLSDGDGVVITDLTPDGIASEVGLREGDVVLKLNRKPVQTVGDFEEAMHFSSSGDNALFQVRRGEDKVFIAMQRPS